MKPIIHMTMERKVTLAPRVRLDAANAPALQSRLETLLGTGVKHFVIDLAETPFLDSAGMVVLLELRHRCQEVGGTVTLVWPQSEPVRRTLQLIGLDRIFEMVDNVQSGQQ